jgi:hypothetical protein
MHRCTAASECHCATAMRRRYIALSHTRRRVFPRIAHKATLGPPKTRAHLLAYLSTL